MPQIHLANLRQDVVGPLHTLVARDPLNRYLTGHILLPEQHPLTWLLNDFPKIDFPTIEQLVDPPDADLLLVDDPLVDSVEPNLHFNYFKEPFQLRGTSTDSATLYLRQGAFGALFPGRVPEFQPRAAEEEK